MCEAQSEERGVQMKRTSSTNSGCRDLFARFLLGTRFVNDRVAHRRFGMEAFGTSWRFSAWLARTDGCAKLRQKRGHDPTGLPWSQRTAFGFPGQQCLPAQARARYNWVKASATNQLQTETGPQCGHGPPSRANPASESESHALPRSATHSVQEPVPMAPDHPG